MRAPEPRPVHATRDVAPLVGAASAALAAGPFLPPWAWMWAIAFAIFGGCKWITLRRARRRWPRSLPLRSIAYLLAWPGMDARSFLASPPAPGGVAPREWIEAGLKTGLGAAITWGGCRGLGDAPPLLVGWAGMIGFVFFLHFGIFHLLALTWRSRGIEAVHIHDHPGMSTSLGAFWGRRWNRAFRELGHLLIFSPLAPRIGRRLAAIVVFGASGIVHELVISVPAGAGYGLPTVYFLLQSAGLFVERSRIGTRLGLRRGARGWLFTAALTAGPAFLLFHPPFVLRVVLPFLDFLGAI